MYQYLRKHLCKHTVFAVEMQHSKKSGIVQVTGITWRAAPLGLAVASFCTCLAVGLGIREPPKGRFIIDSKVLTQI